jgi:hypothetical protein
MSSGDVPVGHVFIYECEGYMPSLPDVDDTCIGCAFDFKNCLGQKLVCMGISRKDKTDVIFKKVN